MLPTESAILSERDRISSEIGKLQSHIAITEDVLPMVREITLSDERQPEKRRDLQASLETAEFKHQQNKALLAKLIEIRDKYFLV